jgi:hypothetical protein
MSDDFDRDGDDGGDGAPEQPREQPDEQELAEAAALAAALDGEPHDRDAPDDALATALLMRHGGQRGELSPERSEAILGALLRDARPAEPSLAEVPARAGDDRTAVPAARKGLLVRLWPVAAGLAAAAAIALAWLSSATPRSAEPAATAAAPVAVAPAHDANAELPRASVQLLAAHGALLREGLQRGRRAGAGDTAAAARESEREAAARFEQELRAYRAELLRALQVRYPAKLGVLERPGARASAARGQVQPRWPGTAGRPR